MKKQKTLENYEDVKEKALRLLEFRSHSEHELKTKLLRAGASSENTDAVIDFCRRYGFVDDESFAKRKAHDLIHLKKYGLHRVKSELKAKGIPSTIIDNVMAEFNKDDECEMLNTLVEKKLNNDFSDKNKDKCIRYFIYRGYDLQNIKNAIQFIKEKSDIDD